VTATKTRRTRRKQDSLTNPDPAAAVTIDPHAVTIAVTQIVPHPDNPRKTFAKDQLKKLGDSLGRHGLLQPLLVRRLDKAGGDHWGLTPQQVQLVCGERRWRAAQLAGLKTVPVVVRTMTDAEALELMIVENEERENLNPIELALGLDALTKPVDKGGAGLSDAEAAERISHTESWAKNLKRLLALPKVWQGMIVKGELPQTFARELLPYVGIPAVLKDVQAQVRDHPSFALQDRESFVDVVDEAIERNTRAIDSKDKPYQQRTPNWRWISIGRLFTLGKKDEALRKQLAIVEIPINDRQGKRTVFPRATNCALWDELQAPALEAWLEKQAKKTNGQNGQSAAAEPQTKAESQAEAKRKEKERAEKLERRIAVWRHNFLRVLVSENLLPNPFIAWGFAIWAATTAREYSGRLCDVIEQLHCDDRYLPGPGSYRTDRVWQMLQLPDSEESLEQCLVVAASRLLWEQDVDDPFYVRVPEQIVNKLARDLDLKIADGWEMAGTREPPYYDLARDFVALHGKEQLEKLGGEFGIEFAGGKKSEMVEEFMQRHCEKRLPLPKSLQ